MDYVTAWTARLAEDEEERLRLFREARQTAEKAARILGDQFSAERVYLIGSLLSEECFTPHSDIDIAVAGLRTDDYFKALNAIGGLLPKGIEGIDLIPVEDADEYLKSVIFEKGIVLYDKEQSACS